MWWKFLPLRDEWCRRLFSIFLYDYNKCSSCVEAPDLIPSFSLSLQVESEIGHVHISAEQGTLMAAVLSHDPDAFSYKPPRIVFSSLLKWRRPLKELLIRCDV